MEKRYIRRRDKHGERIYTEKRYIQKRDMKIYMERGHTWRKPILYSKILLYLVSST